MSTTDELKAASERMMAGYDDLPADVRRAIADCLYNADDVALALSLYKQGMPAERIKAFIREAERRINSDGVMPKTFRGFVLHPSARHRTRQRLLRSRNRGNKP